MTRDYYVYLMTNRSGTLYTGVTNDLLRRVTEHSSASSATFAGRYKTTRLLYFESTSDVAAAVQREKRIKGWTRRRKIELVSTLNPRWLDLSEGWFNDAEKPERLAEGLDSSAAPQNDIIATTGND